MAPLQYPLPLDKLARREELIIWLTWVLFCTLANGIPLDMPRRINLPNNLGAFVGLLVHLQKVGFPSHWIADFIATILADDITTNIRPYLERLPIPITEVRRREEHRKTDLLPWHADFEVIIASCPQALPFSLRLPSAFPTFADIRTYKATGLKVVDTRKHKFVRYWAKLASPHVAVVGLLFYKPSPEYEAEDIAHQIGLVLKEDALPRCRFS
ncbi:hypothetical protein GLOTRDRAFT_138516 [Gloeophyllum trabeum ATCC 11539]|uniref:Uncharacterized protein n=1 Tax=Gloeophyllum trabeum (strain ATCC 11539 / FP-39264 / Madison 617) TaxID=670483 RepID=S7RMM2_GLOTA|nr:uncharacterized protein GLOTRDRAFT_138516 [Gloeophyllum trabeum ATCC 11539]EPQ55700.1 hypothetical protein GLOTRDRAFT_138516 [Gloeophyllum trabeum ATCC 11539]